MVFPELKMTVIYIMVYTRCKKNGGVLDIDRYTMGEHLSILEGPQEFKDEM